MYDVHINTKIIQTYFNCLRDLCVYVLLLIVCFELMASLCSELSCRGIPMALATRTHSRTPTHVQQAYRRLHMVYRSVHPTAGPRLSHPPRIATIVHRNRLHRASQCTRSRRHHWPACHCPKSRSRRRPAHPLPLTPLPTRLTRTSTSSSQA